MSRVLNGDAVVSNTRHLELHTLANDSLIRSMNTLQEKLPTDLLCEDIRQVLHHIGSITGSITTDEILANIFSKFCIGK